MEERINRPVATWEPWIILLGLMSSIFLLIVSLTIFSAILKSFLPEFTFQYLGILEVQLAFLFLVFTCMRQYGPIKFSEFIPQGREYVILGIGLLAVFWGFGLAVGRDGIASEADLPNLSGTSYVLNILSSVLFAPVLEEIFFKRYFFEILRSLYSSETAFCITVIVTTLLHWHPDMSFWGITWHLYSGCVFTAAYIFSRLGVAVSLHSFHNFIVLVLSR